MSASINFQSPQFIQLEIGKNEADAIIAKAEGSDAKVADEILKILGECIQNPKSDYVLAAGMLRHFSGKQLDLLQEKLTHLKNIPQAQNISDIMSAAIYSTTDLVKRIHLVTLKNACLGVQTTALVAHPRYPVVIPFKESSEICEYIEGVKDLVKKTPISYPVVAAKFDHEESLRAIKEVEENIKRLEVEGKVELNERIALDTAEHLLLTVLGVDHRKEANKNRDVQTWIIKNKSLWSEKLGALIETLNYHASREKRGSTLHGVAQSLSFDLGQVRSVFLHIAPQSKEHVLAFQKMCIILREAGIFLRAHTKKCEPQEKRALCLLQMRDFVNKFVQFCQEEGKKNGGVQAKLMALLAPEFALSDQSSFSTHFFYAKDLETCTTSDLESLLEASKRLIKGSMTDKEWWANTGAELQRSVPFQKLFQELEQKLEELRKEEPPPRFEMPPAAPISFL